MLRKTVTLDDDVIALLRHEMSRSGESFKQAVNHYLRIGFALAQPTSKAKRPRRTPTIADVVDLDG